MDEPEEIAEAQGAPDAERPLESWIGAQVRGLRTALGMTLADLAKAGSFSAGLLSTLAQGPTSPSLRSFSCALRTPVCWRGCCSASTGRPGAPGPLTCASA